MTSDATVVVRYDEASRAAVEQTLRKLLRKQGILLLILGMMVGLIFLAPFLVAAIKGVDAPLVFAAPLVVPIAIGALGVRQLRRQPHLPEIAVTITPAAVLFPAIDSPSGLVRLARAEEWNREGTSAEILRASGLKTARVEFTRQDGGKRRRRSIASGNLDVDARVIVEALRAPHTS